VSRAQPKSSPTDEHARRIARTIAKGRPPPFSAERDRYCQSFPGEIFAAFTAAARNMPPAGKDEALAILRPISCKALCHVTVTDGLRSSCVLRYGCAKRLRRPICAGASLRSLQRHSPMDGT